MKRGKMFDLNIYFFVYAFKQQRQCALESDV